MKLLVHTEMKKVYSKNSSYTVSDDVTSAIKWKDYYKDARNNYAIDMASEGSDLTSKEKAAVYKATKVIKNIQDTTFKSIRSIVDAVESAGLSDKKLDDMTDRDWERLNEKLNEYRNW